MSQNNELHNKGLVALLDSELRKIKHNNLRIYKEYACKIFKEIYEPDLLIFDLERGVVSLYEYKSTFTDKSFERGLKQLDRNADFLKSFSRTPIDTYLAFSYHNQHRQLLSVKKGI